MTRNDPGRAGAVGDRAGQADRVDGTANVRPSGCARLRLEVEDLWFVYRTVRPDGLMETFRQEIVRLDVWRNPFGWLEGYGYVAYRAVGDPRPDRHELAQVHHLPRAAGEVLVAWGARLPVCLCRKPSVRWADDPRWCVACPGVIR